MTMVQGRAESPPHGRSGHAAVTGTLSDVALRRVGELADELHRDARNALLETGRFDASWDAEESAPLEEAVRWAIAVGAAIDDIARVTAPHTGGLGHNRAVAALRADAAAVAEVREHRLISGERYGPTLPPAHAARMEDLGARAEAALRASVRRAVVSGLTVREVLRVARSAGLALDRAEVAAAVGQAG